MSHPTTIEKALKCTCCLCHVEVAEDRRGWAATCPRCDVLIAAGTRPSEVALARERELADGPTPDDWAEYAAWAAEAERAFEEAARLDELDAEAALDEPDPAFDLDLEARFGPDYDPAEYAPICGIGHPAAED